MRVRKMEKLVTFEKQDGFATVKINNPPLNVLGSKVVEQLHDVFTTIASDPDIIVVILTGAGDRAFMAGADIKEFPEKLGGNMKSGSIKTHETLNLIASLHKPTIAMLNGITLGGGCELALTCDFRIAEEHVQIGLPEIKLGIFPGGGGTQRLPRLIGKTKAKELMFTGDPLTAQEAKEIGLVSTVVPKGKGMEEAGKLAKRIARHSLDALAMIKQAVDEGMEKPIADAIQLESDLFQEVFQTKGAKEGVQAFLEKRTPQFNR